MASFNLKTAHSTCVQNKCSRFCASLPFRDKCELRHAGVRVLAGMAWLLFVASIYECCAARGDVSFFTGLVGLGVGIECVLPKDAFISTASFYTMVAFAALSLVALLCSACHPARKMQSLKSHFWNGQCILY